MTVENKDILITRIKAFIWHTGTMIAPFAVDFLTTNYHLFNMPGWLDITIGLVLAQVTKYLNTPKG